MGVFGKNSTPPNEVKRNTFDLSHQSNLTMEFGKIYPILHEAVLPGDTFTLDLAAGIRAMPTAFPIQTKLRLDVHAFYVRNRNLYDDFQNFIGRTGNWSSGTPADGLSFPVISPSRYKEIYRTSSLGDYLGLPSTIVGENLFSPVKALYGYSSSGVSTPYETDRQLYVRAGSFGSYGHVSCNNSSVACEIRPLKKAISAPVPFVAAGSVTFLLDVNDIRTPNRPYTFAPNAVLKFTVRQNISDASSSSALFDNYIPYIVSLSSSGTPLYAALDNFILLENKMNNDGSLSVSFRCNKSYTLNPGRSIALGFFLLDSATGGVQFNEDDSNPSNPLYYIEKTEWSISYPDYVEAVEAFPDGAFANFPVVSALPFRAYESIYNAFYRDQRNNPYVVDGVADPNVYLPTKAGGEDDATPCTFRYRNWEQDFITSGVPSPQQGSAPLVGITSTGVATFADEDGVLHRVKLTTADDGNTIVGAEYEKNLPDSVARALVNVASSGISINDFRGVNSLQRWLEVNLRRGLKYRDQIKSHFGVTPSYAELDMPEFIGGMSRYISTMQVDQTAPATGEQPNPLGSYAGQLALSESFNHKIRHYCDEHGYIMVLASIVPVPCYSQVLNKDWLKKDTLDFYFPEFGHLGMQPVTYQEVSPLQASYLGTETTKTYAYQRAWYEYMARTDEVHGDFRTTLKDFCLYREFDSLPVLSEEFLTVRPSQLNNIFLVSEYVDPDTGEKTPIAPFLGQFHFNEVLKRPIPRYGIPRLE